MNRVFLVWKGVDVWLLALCSHWWYSVVGSGTVVSRLLHYMYFQFFVCNASRSHCTHAVTACKLFCLSFLVVHFSPSLSLPSYLSRCFLWVQLITFLLVNGFSWFCFCFLFFIHFVNGSIFC